MTYERANAVELDKESSAAAQDHDAAVVQHPGMLRKFVTLDLLLSVTTGMLLVPEGKEAVAAFAAWMSGVPAAQDDKSILKLLPKVKASLEEQLPFLKDINLSGLYPIFRYDPTPANAYLKVWLDMQTLRYGEDHGVMTIAAWRHTCARQCVPAAAEVADVWL